MNIQKILKAVLFALAVAGAWFAAPYIFDQNLRNSGPVVAVQNGTSHPVIELYISNNDTRTDKELLLGSGIPPNGVLSFHAESRDCNYFIQSTLDDGTVLQFENVNLCVQDLKTWKIVDTVAPAAEPKTLPQ